jgi:hypothetical protein
LRVRVIYVKVGLREGDPEISPRSAAFSRIVELAGFVEGVSYTVSFDIRERPAAAAASRAGLSGDG